MGVLLISLAGCLEKPGGTEDSSSAAAKTETRKDPPQGIVTNEMSLVRAFPGATSNELVHIKACTDALDAGQDAIAMRHARELIDSTDAEVRLFAIEAFGWIGRFAEKELAEMMSDPDGEVRSEALRQWEMAFDGIQSRTSQMQAIERAAKPLKDQHSLEVVMMKLADLDDSDSIMLLSNIISSTNSTPVAAEVARTEYASLVGEPFVDAKRAGELAAKLRNLEDDPHSQRVPTSPKTNLTQKGIQKP